MNHTEQRQRLRLILAGSESVSPADVYDPLSARIAESVGYEIGVLTGAVAANTTLAAPDLSLLTLTEFADQARRIMRVSRLSLLVDADHGYGNALNVMRTVEELEHAGVSALTLEDTASPLRFGRGESVLELVSIPEMTGKLRAAIAARRDPSLVIAGRTSLRTGNLQDTIARANAYVGAGIDALFVVGLKKIDQIDAIRAEVKLPLMLGPVPASLKREELEARGARVLVGGHQPLMAAVKALTETYRYLLSGGDTVELEPRIASMAELKKLIADEKYQNWKHEYLR